MGTNQPDQPYTYPSAGLAGRHRRPGPLPGEVTLSDDPQPKAARWPQADRSAHRRRRDGARPRRRRRVRLPEPERRRLPARRRAARRRVRLPPPRHRPLGRPEDRRRALPRQAAPGQGHPRQRRPSQEALGAGLQGRRATTASRSSATTTDIAPWLGDRVGAAIRPGGTENAPNVAVAIQVKDEAAAKDTLTKLFACDKSGRHRAAHEGRLRHRHAARRRRRHPGRGRQGHAGPERHLHAGHGGARRAGHHVGLVRHGHGPQGDPEAGRHGRPGRRRHGRRPRAGSLRRCASTPTTSRWPASCAAPTATKSVKGDGAEMASLPGQHAWQPSTSRAPTRCSTGVAPAQEADREPRCRRRWVRPDRPDRAAARRQAPRRPQGPARPVVHPRDARAGPQVATSPSSAAKVVSSDAKRADELVGRLMEPAGVGSDVLTHKVEGDKVFVATTPDYADDLKSGGKLGDSDTFKAGRRRRQQRQRRRSSSTSTRSTS